ncbi:MAG: YitT family protein [Chloroflexota bacterium]
MSVKGIRSIAGAYAVLVLGSLLLSVAFAWFLVPQRIAAGGISGLAVVLHYLWGLPTGLLTAAMNVPLLVAGYLFLGGARFTVRTAVSLAVFSLTVDPLGQVLKPITHDPFLSTLYGGVLSGVGIGLVFAQQASTGGTTILARLLQIVSGLSAGYAQLAVDAVVVAFAAAVFGPRIALYALIGLYISSKAIDWVLEGLSSEKVAFIVSDRSARICERIAAELGRGTTLLPGRGGYTGAPRTVVMCVLSQAQEPQLKAIVRTEDALAFMTISAASTVLGEGFTPLQQARTPRAGLRWPRRVA